MSSCGERCIPAPPPFDVPPPPDPSLVFHLLSDEPPEALEKLLSPSCSLSPFSPPLGQLVVPFVGLFVLVMFVSLSVTVCVVRRRRRRSSRRGEEAGDREDQRPRDAQKGAQAGGRKRPNNTRKGDNNKKSASAKHRQQQHCSSSISSNAGLSSSRNNAAFPSSSPSSGPTEDGCGAISRRSSTETVTSVPSPPQHQWLFLQPNGHFAAATPRTAPCTGQCARRGTRLHASPSALLPISPPSANHNRRTVALRMPCNISSDGEGRFAWRTADLPQQQQYYGGGSDLYEEVLVGGEEIAEPPYKWRTTMSKRMPPPASRPPPPPREHSADCCSFASPCSGSSAGTGSTTTVEGQSEAARVAMPAVYCRSRTSPEMLDRGRESGYGTGRSVGTTTVWRHNLQLRDHCSASSHAVRPHYPTCTPAMAHPPSSRNRQQQPSSPTADTGCEKTERQCQKELTYV